MLTRESAVAAYQVTRDLQARIAMLAETLGALDNRKRDDRAIAEAIHGASRAIEHLAERLRALGGQDNPSSES